MSNETFHLCNFAICLFYYMYLITVKSIMTTGGAVRYDWNTKSKSTYFSLSHKKYLLNHHFRINSTIFCNSMIKLVRYIHKTHFIEIFSCKSMFIRFLYFTYIIYIVSLQGRSQEFIKGGAKHIGEGVYKPLKAPSGSRAWPW